MSIFTDKSLFLWMSYVMKSYLELIMVFASVHQLLKKKEGKIPLAFISIVLGIDSVVISVNYLLFFEKDLAMSMLLQCIMFLISLIIVDALYEDSILKKVLATIISNFVGALSIYVVSGIVLKVFGFYMDPGELKYVEEIPTYIIYIVLVVIMMRVLLFLLQKPFTIYRNTRIRSNPFFLFLSIASAFIPTIMVMVSDELKEETYFSYMFMLLFSVLIIGGFLLYYYSKDLRSQVTSFKNLYMLQSQHYKALEESIEKTEELKEDINMHVKSIQLLQEQEKECFEFESELMKRYEEVNSIIFTNNTRIDALLYYYFNLCKEKNIEFQSHMKLTIDITDFQYDVHEVLKRMLEKAWKDCNSQRDNEMKSMSIETFFVKNCFFLRIEYSKNQVPRNVTNHYFLEFIKKHIYQVDLKPIQNICYKYNGKVDLAIEKEIHKMTAMFQMEDVKK